MKKLTLDLGGGFDLPQLTDEEMKRRIKELTNMTSEEKELMRDITGKQNSRIVSLDVLFNEVLEEIQKGEEDDDDYIEETEYSAEFMKFLQWYFAEKAIGHFWTKYQKNYDIFEEIFNRDLEKYDTKNILDYLSPEQRKTFNQQFGKNCEKIITENEVTNSQEAETLERFEVLSTTNTDLIELFLRIEEHEGDSWERFAEYIKNNESKNQPVFDYDEEK